MIQRSFLATLIASGLMVVPTTGHAAAGAPVDLKTHKPRFHWKSSPGEARGIYDGDARVADFYGGAGEMRGIGRPISLHNLRLIPGGPLAIDDGESCGPLCLSWRKHLIFYMKIDELSVDARDPDRFRLYVKSHDVGLRADQPYQDAYRPDNVVEEAWLELTYAPGLPSYIFDVRMRLAVRPGREQGMISRDMGGLEFCDILPANCNAPPDQKRFHHYVYKGSDGILYRLPHDTHRGPEKLGLFHGSGGAFAFLLEPHHNPVVELVGDTGPNSFSEICHAMYDVHFKLSREKELELLAAGKPLEAHFRLCSISQDAGRKMLEEAVWDPRLLLPGARRPPLAVGVVNGFEPSTSALHPTGPFTPGTDGAECIWDGAIGYRSGASLSIARESRDGAASWEAWLHPLHSSGLRPDRKCRVKAMIRREGGAGAARLILQVGGVDRGVSPPLRGEFDWVPVTLEIAPANGPATLKLVQEGAGRTWFDSVEVTQVERP